MLEGLSGSIEFCVEVTAGPFLKSHIHMYPKFLSTVGFSHGAVVYSLTADTYQKRTSTKI